MSSTISTIVHTIWTWLTALTTGLGFATALSGCYRTATLVIKNLRHWMRSRRPDHPSQHCNPDVDDPPRHRGGDPRCLIPPCATRGSSPPRNRANNGSTTAARRPARASTGTVRSTV